MTFIDFRKNVCNTPVPYMYQGVYGRCPGPTLKSLLN